MSEAPKTSNTPLMMDARKFVRQINSGAAARLKTLEETVERLGRNAGKHLRLTSVDATTIFYEDLDNNRYFTADIKKGRRGRLQIDNIRPIQIVEEDKASHFHKNVGDLVENICKNNLAAADKAFNKIESQRFRSRVVPNSGWITLKDGVSRHVTVSSRVVKEEHVSNIIRIFTESVKDDVVMDKGRIVRGTLNDGREKFVIPINEYTKRRLTAFKMRSHASNAYKSKAFQDMVVESAASICEGKIAAACKLVAKFLHEEEEFCLLDLKGMKTLVENAMATRRQFNSMLSSDVAMLMYKTNLKVNKGKILEAWTKMAQKSEHAGLLNNVNVLAESADFEGNYNKFLDIVFNEDTNVQQDRARAYRVTLRVIASVLPDFEEDVDEEVTASVDELNELVERLSAPEPDTDAILQAEELLAGIGDSLVDSIQDLASFDSVPGEEGAEEGEDAEEGGEEGELIPLPKPEGEEGMEGMEGEEAEGPPLPGEEEEEKPFPPMEGKLISVEKMGVGHLLEELEAWRVHGDVYLNEDGYDNCHNDMQRYIKRCIHIGPKANVIRESFETMRDRMVRTGTEVLAEIDDDPYTASVMAALNGSDRLLESNNKNDPERDPQFWGNKKPSVAEGRIAKDYRHLREGEQPWELSGGLSDSSGLRMDDIRGSGGISSRAPTKSDGRSAGGEKAGYHERQRGNGVVTKGTKPVDGRKGQNSNSGSAGGSLRMDDLQGGGGVQKQGTSETDGKKGHNTSSTSTESTVNPGPSDPALAKGGYSSVGLSMGKDYQKDAGSVVPKSLSNGNGASGDGASAAKKYKMTGLSDAGLDMAKEYQGKGGVADQSPTGEHPGDKGKVGNDGNLKKASRSGDMSDLQGSDGVAESITPERIAALLTLTEREECERGECGPDCDKCKGLSEEAKKGTCGSCGKPNFICKCGGSDSDGDSDSDSDSDSGNPFGGKDDKKDDDKDDKDDDDKKDSGNPFAKSEDQYKGPSRKYKNRGLKKSAVAPVSEGRVAAFVGDAEGVADAVDRVLSQMGDEDLDVQDLSGGPLDEVAPEPELGPEEADLGDEGDYGDEDIDLDSKLSDALAGDEGEGGGAEADLGPEVGGSESDEEPFGEDTSDSSGSDSDTCKDCSKSPCECCEKCRTTPCEC